MIQRFIELGEGYGDIYEMAELIASNEKRFLHGFIFESKAPGGEQVLSFAAAFEPAAQGNFMPIYICREGIPVESKRLALFEETVRKTGREPVRMTVKHSSMYAEKVHFFSHLIAILRLNHFIPPMQ